jgi:hypothetical protein
MTITASAAPMPIPAFAPMERPEEERAAGVPVEDTDTPLVLTGLAPTAEKEVEAETFVALADTACDVADVGVSVIATTIFFSSATQILIQRRRIKMDFETDWTYPFPQYPPPLPSHCSPELAPASSQPAEQPAQY